MRRSEFEHNNQEEFDFITSNGEIGHLGLVDERGYPRIVPLNFVAVGTSIYFHGADSGEKYDLMTNKPKATFSVDIPYSYIPSHWQSPRNAAPATHFFKSLHIHGTALIVEAIEERAKALQALMEKYQPEGKHEPIISDHELYRKQLMKMGVFVVVPDEYTIKIKFGQNMPPDKLDEIMGQLRIRGESRDLDTINAIQQYRP